MELLIDGVRYKLWTPQKEEDLEEMIKEHAKDIFGEDSIYFDIKQKIKSAAGIGSIPDGYVITFWDTPCWYIVEVELSSHPLYEHIVTQVTKFSRAINDLNTQRAVVDAIYIEIRRDIFKQTLVQEKIGAREIYEFLSGLISSPPILVIVIEEKTKELEEVCTGLPLKTKVVELKTFEREGVGLAVHAHLFEPVYRPSPAPLSPPPLPPAAEYIELELKDSMIKNRWFYVPKVGRALFPDHGSPFQLETDVGIIETWLDKDGYISKGMGKWFGSHGELRVGQKLTIEAIEPKKRYRLKIR